MAQDVGQVREGIHAVGFAVTADSKPSTESAARGRSTTGLNRGNHRRSDRRLHWQTSSPSACRTSTRNETSTGASGGHKRSTRVTSRSSKCEGHYWRCSLSTSSLPMPTRRRSQVTAASGPDHHRVDIAEEVDELATRVRQAGGKRRRTLSMPSSSSVATPTSQTRKATTGRSPVLPRTTQSSLLRVGRRACRLGPSGSSPVGTLDRGRRQEKGARKRSSPSPAGR